MQLGPHGAEYDAWGGWAGYYDRSLGDHARLVDFYSTLVSDRIGSLLDLACGTGALTVALAAMLPRGARARVVGLDASSEMLRVARERAPAHDWVLGDMRTPSVEGCFDLVISTHNSLQLLESDEDFIRTLDSARSLLSDHGVFAFDIYQPNREYLSTPLVHRLARCFHDDDGQPLELREDTSYDEDSRILTVRWRLFRSGEGDAQPLAESTYPMRQYFAPDVARLIDSAGLEIRDRYGDLDRSEFTATSRKQVIVCRAV